MPRLSIDGQAFKDAAAMLRNMADILEQQPEEVTSLNYGINTDNFLLGGTPFEQEYHVIIRTHPTRKGANG